MLLRRTMREEPLAKFLPKAKLGDQEFDGGIANAWRGLVWPKNAFEIWGNPKSLCHISVHYLKIPPYFPAFNDSVKGEDIMSLD